MALGPFVVASILAATVGRAAFGDRPVMALPTAFGVASAWELLLYVGLGVVTGVFAVLYSRGVWKTQDAFAGLSARWIQVLLGALIVGGLDLAFRADLWGHGHESLDLGIVTARGGLFQLALAAAKLVATAVTFGAGGTGGVFTPALFIGATLGGAYGVALRDLLPGAEFAPGALAVVGMAGLVAGATHAPLTAIMMVFEMTGDYGLMLPLMLTSVLAYGIARRLHPESIYTEWLVRRGVVLTQGADAAVLARLPVHECLNRRPVVIPEGANLQRIVELIGDSRQTDFPVVDDCRTPRRYAHARGGARGAGERRSALEHPPRRRPCRAGARPPNQRGTLLTALRRLGGRDVTLLPVVSPDDRSPPEETLSRQDLMAAYERGLTAEGH